MSGEAAVRVTQLDEADLGLVADLEAQSFPDAWNLKSLRDTWELETSLFLGAWRASDPRLAGYVIFSQVPPEGEILRIAVAPADRHQGVAAQLLDTLLDRCRQAGITRVMLEVRSGNTPALSLYEKAGFQTEGVRKAYYQDPVEDAILLGRQI